MSRTPLIKEIPFDKIDAVHEQCEDTLTLGGCRMGAGPTHILCGLSAPVFSYRFLAHAPENVGECYAVKAFVFAPKSIISR